VLSERLRGSWGWCTVRHSSTFSPVPSFANIQHRREPHQLLYDTRSHTCCIRDTPLYLSIFESSRRADPSDSEMPNFADVDGHPFLDAGHQISTIRGLYQVIGPSHLYQIPFLRTKTHHYHVCPRREAFHALRSVSSCGPDENLVLTTHLSYSPSRQVWPEGIEDHPWMHVLR
jgi:hypothetical protein